MLIDTFPLAPGWAVLPSPVVTSDGMTIALGNQFALWSSVRTEPRRSLALVPVMDPRPVQGTAEVEQMARSQAKLRWDAMPGCHGIPY